MTVEEARAEFQRQLDGALADDTLYLDLPRERPGPVVLRRPLTVDGQGCTLWAKSGPVVTVEADNAALRNLRIENTAEGTDEGPSAGVALWVAGGGLMLDNVTVRGSVVGLAAEEGQWRYPHQLNLGALAHGVPHELTLRVVVPVPCQLTSEVAGVALHPRTLTPGAHEVKLSLERMLKDTLIHGTIAIKTAFLRREIALNAHVLSPVEGLPNPASGPHRVAWQPPDWDAILAARPTQNPPPRSAASRPAAPPPVPTTAAAPRVKPPPVLAQPAVGAPPVPTTSRPPAATAGTAPALPPLVVAPPPPPPRPAPSVRQLKTSLPGKLFSSPPISTPAPGASSPPLTPPPPAPVGTAPEPSAPASVPLRPASPLFSPPPPPPASGDTEQSEAAEEATAPAAPPPKKKSAPGLPSWVKPPKPTE